MIIIDSGQEGHYYHLADTLAARICQLGGRTESRIWIYGIR